MDAFVWALVLLALVAGAWYVTRRRKRGSGVAPDGTGSQPSDPKVRDKV